MSGQLLCLLLSLLFPGFRMWPCPARSLWPGFQSRWRQLAGLSKDQLNAFNDKQMERLPPEKREAVRKLMQRQGSISAAEGVVSSRTMAVTRTQIAKVMGAAAMPAGSTGELFQQRTTPWQGLTAVGRYQPPCLLCA